MTTSAMAPVMAEAPLNSQRLFVRYFNGFLIDLVVLNLFVEYSMNVSISSFTISLLAAAVLQLLLQLTIAFEHRIGAYFKAKPGAMMKFLRIFVAWLVLFGSKFVILEALAVVFGDEVQFRGAFHGVVALIVVVVTMLAAEEVVVRIYRWLGTRTAAAKQLA